MDVHSGSVSSCRGLNVDGDRDFLAPSIEEPGLMTDFPSWVEMYF